MTRLGERLSELWRCRELVVSFAVRDIKARYKQTALGAAWAILQPLSLMVVFTLVFSRFAKVPTDGIPYPIFAYTSLIFWTFFAGILSQGTVAIVANSPLVRKIYFPRETLLLSVIISAGVDLAVAAAIFVGMLAYYHVPLTLVALWTPVLLLVETCFALGVICLTSAIHVNFRDVGHSIPLALQLWMFATPVAYPLALVPSSLLPLFLLNPMTPIVEGYRRVILESRAPNLTHLGIASLITLALLCVGYGVFRRCEQTFADIV